VKSLIKNLRGLLVFSGITLNTMFWFVPILLLALVKLLPVVSLRRAITRVLMWMGESWIAINSWLFTHACSIDWQARGVEGLSLQNWYLVVSNHQTWVDILVLQKVFNRRIPFLKFFIKQQLIWFPFLGLAWWALDMPFMKRYSPSYLAKNPHKKGTDLETTRNACEKFRETPTSVINFIEGTRFSEQKRDARNSPYQHLLAPRAGGFAIAMSSMGQLFNAILDVTLVYPAGPAKFWGLCCGEHVPVIIEVREREVDARLVSGDYQSDREFRRYVHGWLNEAWTDKDALIASILKE
jgi:1-acyl-sn-glycerol-3-phosphate acyltransferase